MRHVRCKICPNSMFQKWQLWTKLHKFEKTAQLAALGRARAHRESWPGPPQLNTIWDNSGTKLETATVSTKFEGPRDGQERTKEAEGWLAWPRNTLCVSIYRVSRVMCDVWRASVMPNVPITSITQSRVGGGRNIQTFKSSFVTFPTSSRF